MDDMVLFTFKSTNHTITRSSLTAPCVKLVGGADSGFMSNPNDPFSLPPTFMFQVTVATPIYKLRREVKNLIGNVSWGYIDRGSSQ